jgi:3-methyladenine DNA glycosylase Tag
LELNKTQLLTSVAFNSRWASLSLATSRICELKTVRTIVKKTFVFTGGEIVNEFLMSTSYLNGAHQTDCPIRQKCDNALT